MIGTMYFWSLEKPEVNNVWYSSKWGYTYLIILSKNHTMLGFGGSNGIKVLNENSVFNRNREIWVEV